MPRCQQVDVHVVPMETPADASGIRVVLAGAVDARDVVAVIGKSEGTGLGKDEGRERADHAIRTTFAEALGIPLDEVDRRLCIVLSGGTPGVLTPHVALVSVRWVDVPDDPRRPERLVVGTAHSRPIPPEQVGRLGQVSAVADAVRAAMAAGGLADPRDVHLALVKAPSLSEAAIADASRRGADVVSTDPGIGPNGAMCFSNDASALGVASALGEIDAERLVDGDIRRDWSLFSQVAMTSSGGEKTHAEVLLFGNSRAGVGELRIGHCAMRSIVDSSAVAGALASAGLEGDPLVDRDRIVYLLAKMIIPGSDRLFGRRITLRDDPLGYHVAKAMGGYLLASSIGQTMCFVSGGEYNSHQGPPDGNPLAAIVRVA